MKRPILILASFINLSLIHHPIRTGVEYTTYHAPAMMQEIKAPDYKPLTELVKVDVWPNDYAPGNCTWGVAEWVDVPDDMGNANTWDEGAARHGFVVSNVPVVGAVAQTDGDSYYGHVALVMAVNGSQVLIKEMNAQGLGVTDERWTSVSEFRYLYIGL